MNSLIVELISGAIGGNVAGAAMKDKSLGAIGNTIAGLIGGAGGAQLLSTLAPQLLDGIAGQAGSSGVAGAVITVIVGIIKSKLAAK